MTDSPATGPQAAAATPAFQSLVSLQQRRSFRRFELKFVIPEAQAGRLHTALQDWTTPDPHSPLGGYLIESLYYDTDDLRCYWEKIDGIRLRRKVRIRCYLTDTSVAGLNSTPPNPPTTYLEVKQRLDRITQKRRTPLSLDAATAFLDHGQRPQPAPLHAPIAGDNTGTDNALIDSALIDEVEVMRADLGLQATCITGYRRTALLGTQADTGLRVTFDRDLYYRRTDLLLGSGRSEGDLLRPGFVVVEVKVNDRLPGWLSTLIGRQGLAVTRISKYVQAVERSGAAPTSVFHHNPGEPQTAQPQSHPQPHQPTTQHESEASHVR